MAIKNTVSSNFDPRSSIVKSVFDSRLSVVIIVFLTFLCYCVDLFQLKQQTLVLNALIISVRIDRVINSFMPNVQVSNPESFV